MNYNPENEEHAAERWLVSEVKLVRQPLLLSISAALLAVVVAVAQARVLATACHRAVIDGVTVAALKPLALYLILFALFRAVLTLLAERQSSRAAAALKSKVRSSLYRRIHVVQVSGKAADSGALVEAVTQGVDSLEPYVARFIPHLAVAALFPPLCMLLLFPLDWRSGAVLLFSAPFIPLFMVLIGKGAQSLNRQQWSRLAVLSGHLLDLVRGLPDLKICSAAKREAAAVARVSEEYRHSTMAVLRVAFLSAFTLEFFSTVGTAVVAVIIGFRLLSGSLALVDGLFVLLVAPEFYLPFRTLGLSYHARMQGVAAAEKLAPLLAADCLPKQRPLPAAVPAGALTIAFEGVTFRHGADRGGVTAVDLLLPAGSVTALVGASGAGKSTLAGLLLALAPPAEGRITANGIDIGLFNPAEWHRRLAWIPQKPFFFCGTLRENLVLGLPSCSDADMHAALDAAAALPFVQQLPGALDYRLGDSGAGLSGGELRRLAITRVLLRRADLIILDEPTAGLDSDNEQLVMAALAKLAEGRTLLLISHREETVSWAE
ncbi:MAG: cydD, partial [Deltaproteobacteria bacterium]|nr:cydD [Deltaproteobacteria bacterium]